LVRTAAFIKGNALAAAMPREARPEDAPRPIDPRRALAAESALAARMLAGESDLRGSAAQHIQSRDPRARLDAAAAQLHGGKADLPFPQAQGEADAPAKKPRVL
jgi:hypothetical protein